MRSSSGRRVLDGLSLKSRTGEKLAICGRSGSGKSTLLQVLLKILDVSEGSLVVLGKDTTYIPPRIHRKRFNTIPQESYFFQGTFRENLTRGDDVRDDLILRALSKVGLQQKVLGLGGIDHDLEPETFSSGECQLLSLARAILHPTKILLLDEAASSVDAKTDKKMDDIMWEEFKSDTIIAVLHKQEALHRFDRVIILDQGKIAYQARPPELQLAN
ncbi:hypothetical protein AAFC00_001610 [Neodothiora populina]|uniref:ABC transporter domain-containing protein n=1 Tax=Neodothiora populina TaxID=2781224 RepID=A0ABR3PPF9_9PEZI